MVFEMSGVWIVPVAVDVPDVERWRNLRVLCELLEEVWVCELHECRELREEFWKHGWEGVTYSICGVDNKLTEQLVKFFEG